MAAIRPDWLSKSLAGTVLGFTLALAIAGIFAWFGPGGLTAPNKYQFVMWMIAPLWFAVLGFTFLFASGVRAWLWLGGANLLLYSGFFAGRYFFG